MKNQFDDLDINQDKIELVKQTEAETQRVLVAQIRPQKNHILFEFDLINKEVRRAEFTKSKIVSYEDAMIGGRSERKEVDGKEGCVYISAMNEKNAWKKFRKQYT